MNTATATTTRLRTAFASAIAASTLCAAPHASGENLNYDASGVATPLWSDTAGWKTEGGTAYGAVPSSSDTIWLNSASIADPNPLRIASGTAAEAGKLIVCTTKAGDKTAIQIEDGGSLAVSGADATDFTIGNWSGAKGILRMTGGSVSSGGPITIGGNGRGEVFLDGGSLNSTPIQLGYMSGHGDGYLKINGGNVNGFLKIGLNGNATGTVEFAGGTIASGKLATIGEAGVGRFVFDGGVHQVTGDVWDFKIGDQATSRGELVLLKTGLSFGSSRKLFVGYHGTFGDAGRPDLVNSAKFSVSGTTTSDTYFRGGVFAPDRTDLNLDKLPENKGIAGVWRFGLFTSTAHDFPGFQCSCLRS
jgi:hypothetical protein